MALVAASATPTECLACYNGVELEVNPKVAALQAAEASLRVGELSRAGQLVTSHFPKLRATATLKSVLEQRAMRVFAMVIIRSKGAWREKTAPPNAQNSARNIAFAVRQLRLRAIAKPGDAMRVTDLGEALEQVGEFDEATHILETLAKSTSITSAEGWSALARLRAKTGDLAGQKHAETMCRSMTHNKSTCQTGGVA